MGCGDRAGLKKKLGAERGASQFDLAADLEIELVLGEPRVQQPLHLSFDERGRLWVVQYIQYPDPAGLREVSRDKVWRTIYDKVPPPPPHAEGSPFRGRDKITIHEDSDGDGQFDRHKVFLEGLNLATSVAHGRGGVWVTNPPYLLFYPDADRDDVPDGPPEVHLKGFGLEDTHSIASSLYWGPDGWLYGAQGSTVSAAILRPGIDEGDEEAVKSMGQNVWRYHPERKIYEVFAEGGGNTFGVEIDSKGRVYSGHNGGDTRGFHYVQGGYYRKSFGKHGELSNPYSFGYFPAMRHAKVARFVHQFIIYEGAGLPERFSGRLLGVDVLHNNLVLSEISPLGSTFETKDIERPVATADKNFRPVHVVEAPDGSVFVADWYDEQVNHYRNHEGQIDHEKGRVYRVRSKGARPVPPVGDLAALAGDELVSLLDHPSRWHRQTALRLLWDRGEMGLRDGLARALGEGEGLRPIELLWASAACGGFDRQLGLMAMAHEDPHVRLWGVRLLEDLGLFDAEIADRVVRLATIEEHPEVLSQIACTARRISGKEGLRIAAALVSRYELAEDPHLPLLVWWAIEAHCDELPDVAVDLVAGTRFAEKLIRRLAMVGRRADLERCATLLGRAQEADSRDQLLVALEGGLSGRSLDVIPETLARELSEDDSWAALAIRLRQGSDEALKKAIELVSGDRAMKPGRRRTLVASFGQVREPQVIQVLLDLVADNEAGADLRATAIRSLSRFDRPSIAERLIGSYKELPPAARAAAMDLLTSRSDSASRLVTAVRDERIDRSEVSLAHVEKLRQLDPELAHDWPVPTTQSREEMVRIREILSKELGVPKRGEVIFGQRCAACHRMFERGGEVGPDLTSYQKNDLDTLLLAVIDPGAEIREGYEQAVVRTRDGAVRSGFVVEQDADRLILRELSGGERTFSRADILKVDELAASLMPAGLLAGLDATQLRDLFAYLRSTTPPF